VNINRIFTLAYVMRVQRSISTYDLQFQINVTCCILETSEFSSTEPDILKRCGCIITLPCEKTRSTNADVAKTPKKQ